MVTRGYSRLPPVARMKTVRGIFLTTRGHPGTAVSKDCELNEGGGEPQGRGYPFPLASATARARALRTLLLVRCVVVSPDDTPILSFTLSAFLRRRPRFSFRHGRDDAECRAQRSAT